jgi:hypothetical protein
MKELNSKWVRAVLLASCAVNSFFLLPDAWKAGLGCWQTRGLSNPERRILQKGDWYRVVVAVGGQMPTTASIRLVSPAPPWYLAYYLYPRLLKKGSETLKDLETIRTRYPGDWVLFYAETPPEMKAYPPLNPGAS